MDVRTGEMLAWFAADPHDLWDQDCSWGGILGNSGGRTVYIAGCKTGVLHALDAETLEPIWIYDSPTIPRDWGSGSGGFALDRMEIESLRNKIPAVI